MLEDPRLYDLYVSVSFRMQRYRVGFIFLSLVVFAHAEWLKMYEEEEHRPTYYNRAHRPDQHVDYSRSKMAARDKKWEGSKVSLPPFEPEKHLSFYVNILYMNSVLCAGSMISRRMVITSSRCFMGTETAPVIQYKARYMTVMTGNYFGNPFAQAWPVIAFFQPSPKQGEKDVHDISLLGLAKKLDRETHRYIGLYRKHPPANTAVLMAFVYPATRDITFYNTSVVDIGYCKRQYEQAEINITMGKEYYCVKNRRSSGCATRPGDPLIIDNQLAGINLYGEQCDELDGSQDVDIYYNIRSTIKFIQTATDLLRGFTGTGPFDHSLTTVRTKLHADTTTVKPENVEGIDPEEYID